MVHNHNLKANFLKEGYVDGIVSSTSTAENKLKINKDTSKYLFEKLKKDGYFNSTRLEINLPKIGLDKFAWLFISFNWDSINEEQFYKKALSLAHVHTIAETTGEFDFAIKIFGATIQQINSFVMAFEKFFSDSIVDTQIMYSIHEYKRHYVIIDKEPKMSLKKIDCQVLVEKNNNPTKSLLEISKQLGIHRNTVSKSWNKLWENKIILKESLELTDLGFNEIKKSLKAFVIIKATPGFEEKVINECKKLTEIQDVFLTMSNLVVVTIRIDGSSSLADFHRDVFRSNKYIRKTNTLIFLRKKTRSYLNKHELNAILGKDCHL